MEIIHIILGKANPNRLNGVNKVVYQMATEQAKAGKNVQVWGITANPLHDYPERNFKTRLFKAKKNPFAVPYELQQAIQGYKSAVFHLHGGWVPVFSSLAKILCQHNIRYVLTPHGAYNEIAMKRSAWRKKLYFILFEKALLRNVYKVHSIGNSEVEGLAKLCPSAPSFLSPYGFNYNDIDIYSPENEVFTIGFVGRLDIHTKGLDLLMEAFNRFRKSHPDAALWVIGDGEGKTYLEHFIEEKKLPNVTLWGKKFGQEKDELIRKMHVFAHPSRNEGLPTAVLEAAALGVPSIVTQATNVAGYLTDFQAGFAINDNSINELLNALEQMYQAYESKQVHFFRQGARNMLEQVFSWPVLVEKYNELYTV